MNDELKSLRDCKAWELTSVPPGSKTIGCRWIYKKKQDEQGKIIRYKARLVAQGFTQRYGLDYDEVFAPVAKQVTLRTLLTVAGRDGMKVRHVDVKTAYLNGAYCLDQKAYIDKLVEQFGLADAKVSRIPMDVGYLQQKEELESLPNNDKFQSLVGGLLYLSVNTRPDIAISTSILGRQVSKPTNADWTEAKRVLRYLKATSELKLVLGAGKEELQGYADADWAGNVKDRKSNSGYLFRLGGVLISWCARKQACVALSSTEAEYISLAESCRELLWLKKLLKDFGEPVQKPVQIFEETKVASRCWTRTQD
ncbi:hypothetical protein RP20_CCG000421 [Aedes albopictus]|nr:hypothetical protein RP20_CCG000421 [Aedes albopictus]